MNLHSPGIIPYFKEFVAGGRLSIKKIDMEKIEAEVLVCEKSGAVPVEEERTY
jgi:hypothetical protein